MNWQERLRIASNDFGRAVWPQIQSSFPWAKEVVSAELEGLDGQAAGLLDRQGGIDWVLSDGRNVSTLTARVQYVPPSASITVGQQELVRWERAFEQTATGTNWVAPDYLAHGYVDRPGSGQFMLGAVTRTESVYTYMHDRPDCVRWKTNHETGRSFGVVDLQCFWDSGFEADFYLGDACDGFTRLDRPFVVRSLTHTCPNCGSYESDWDAGGSETRPDYG